MIRATTLATKGPMVRWRDIAPEPEHAEAAAALLEHHGVVWHPRAETFLEDVAAVFGRMPYENLTKLVKKATLPPGRQRLRLPAEVFRDHLEVGAGGTCFSLSTLFGLALVRHGLTVYPVLARMRTVRALHCGLVVPLSGKRYLLDPGYLVCRPVPLEPGGSSVLDSPTGPVEVRGQPDGSYDLYTQGRWRYRFRDEPLDTGRFLELWEDSFDWVMMNGLHASRALDGGYAYVHGHRMRIVQGSQKRNRNIRRDQAQVLGEVFGMDPSFVARALEVLERSRRGEAGSLDGAAHRKGRGVEVPP